MPALINTGPSPNGMHAAETFAICPRRRGFNAHPIPGAPRFTDALARGTLVHVGLAHHYARMRAKQRGEDPDRFYPVADAVRLMVGAVEPVERAVMARHVAPVMVALAAYDAHYATEITTTEIVAVEQVVEIPLPGFGGEGEPAAKTARIDLITRKTTPGSKLLFTDHKSAARIQREQAWYYARTWQFLGLRWLGRALGDVFGGVVLNQVQVGVAGPAFRRPSMDPVPGFFLSMPAGLAYFERLRWTFEKSGLPPALWPAVASEHTCRGRYSRCDHAARCEAAYPQPTQPLDVTVSLTRVEG